MPILSWLRPNGDFRTTAQSVQDVLSAAGLVAGGGRDKPSTSPELNGTYFNGSEVGQAGPEAKDDAKCKTLWTDGIRFAEVQEGDAVLADWR